ncbi:hypothetical protein [Pedobacter cryoconitis]|uniref:Uncharacterized protein n=1 Tax=Pedobacter cryoconitis TaxID=188932 RepID=A0A7X0J4F0_9SPHI|nr:hypothetical protein [Pedobacter cryoconitis]MBB6500469.1 hypothetical protein [Pedobacter cryoconitis]
MMNQEDIFKKIGQILSELNDQYQYLAQNPRELNELELELFLANASFLSDHVHIIQKLNNGHTQHILPEHTEETPVPVLAEDDLYVHEILPAKPKLDEEMFKLDKEHSTFEFILNEKPASDKFEFEEKSVDEIFDRPLSKEEELIIAQKQKLREKDSLGIVLPEEDEIGPEPFLVEDEPVHEIHHEVADPVPAAEPVKLETQPVEEYIPETKSVVQEELFAPVKAVVQEEVAIENEVPAEIDAAKPKTLNEILSGGTQSTLNSGSSRVQVKDLKQAISLNDKMRYIKDLFNGYNLAYAEAIDLVNKMPDFKSADEFLQRNYAQKNNWAAKQDTADQFYELLNQRFSVK